MRAATIIMLVIALAVVMVGCEKAQETTTKEPPAKAACETCAKGKAGETVWCEGCGAGYVGGEKTGCESCFAAKKGGPACPTCAAK